MVIVTIVMQSSSRFNQKYFTKLTGWTLLALALFIGALLFFVYIMHEVLWDKEEELDNAFFSFLSENVISSQLTRIMEVITYGASGTFLKISYGLLVIGYLVKKNWKRSVEIAVVGLGGFVVNYILKLSFQRLRPPNPLIEPLHNFSFPSGHATSGFIFYGLLLYLIWKTKIHNSLKYIFGSILVFLALVIGFSRIYLRLHYLSDVVAGFCVGIAWLSLSIWLMERLKKKSDVELKQTSERIIS